MKHMVIFDLEDGELLAFPWDEEGDPPPLVRGRKEDENKKN